MHPFNIRKEDKCNLSVFALWRQAKRKLFAGLWGSLSFYAAKASRMFVNATLHNLELNIGNLAASACVNWMIYLQPIKIEYMKKEMKNRRRTCSDCMTRSSILESVSTWEKRIERDCVLYGRMISPIYILWYRKASIGWSSGSLIPRSSTGSLVHKT